MVPSGGQSLPSIKQRNDSVVLTMSAATNPDVRATSGVSNRLVGGTELQQTARDRTSVDSEGTAAHCADDLRDALCPRHPSVELRQQKRSRKSFRPTK
jgi:hypothetical protein